MALRIDLAWELVMMSLGAMMPSESRDLKLLKESATQSPDLYIQHVGFCMLPNGTRTYKLVIKECEISNRLQGIVHKYNLV